MKQKIIESLNNLFFAIHTRDKELIKNRLFLLMKNSENFGSSENVISIYKLNRLDFENSEPNTCTLLYLFCHCLTKVHSDKDIFKYHLEVLDMYIKKMFEIN